MKLEGGWGSPRKVDDLTLAFPADAETDLMPAWEEIPQEFRDGISPWAGLQWTWFFWGLPDGVKFHLKPGVDGDTALRHLEAVQRCYGPGREHKEAAVEYLASLWFDAVVLSPTRRYPTED